MNIGIIGATGAVGRNMLAELEASNFSQSIDRVQLFASARSEGTSLTFKGKSIPVQAWSLEKAKECKFILMSAGGQFSRTFAQDIAKQGSIVIDNSSAWRMDPSIPLVIPEVNPDSIQGMQSGIIANPNCSTIQLLVALKPIEEAYGLETVMVSTYQSVSGSGQQGIQELLKQMKDHSGSLPIEPKLYDQPIFSNVIPWIGEFEKGEGCEEELKMENETKKILQNDSLDIFAATARVPVLHCHTESVTVQTKSKITFDGLERILQNAAGVELHQHTQPSEIPTPLHCKGRSKVFVSRLRPLASSRHNRWFHFWNIADNLKKGAATNAVQILELLLKKSF